MNVCLDAENLKIFFRAITDKGIAEVWSYTIFRFSRVFFLRF